MRIAVLADIHGNLPALRAVLSHVERQQPDRIISLGDQINLGPCAGEVMALLRQHHVTCLHGNHERYVLEALRGAPQYQAANFGSVRFAASQITAEEITLPVTLRLGQVLFCHAMPEDDRFPVPYPKKAIPMLAEHEPEAKHIICGHCHDPRHYAVGGCTVDVVGSLGCMDNGIPGWACYGELLLEEEGFCFTNRFVPYDAGQLRPLFLSTGYAKACPIMARVICMQMEQNHVYMLRFVDMALSLSRQKGEAQISPETWQETDRAFGWPDGLTAEEFWHEAEKQCR